MAKGFFKLPRDVAERRDLSSAATRAYAAIADWVSWRPGAPVGARAVGARAGLPRTTAQRAIAELEAKGLISVSHRGSGRSTVYALAGEGSAPRAECWPERCPWAGRKVPTAGPVSCPLTARIAPTQGRAMIGVRTPSSLKEQERAGLSPNLLDFAEWIRKERGRRLSDRQLWELNPAFVGGVPLGFAQRQADRWALGVPPWTFAAELAGEWGLVGAAVESCRRYFVGGQGESPTVAAAALVVENCQESELPAVFGERWRDVLSWVSGRGQGKGGGESRS